MAEVARPTLVATVFAFVGLLFGCADGGAPERSAQRAPSSVATTAAPTTLPPSTTTSTTTTAPPRYDATVALVDDTVRPRMTSSWRPGCPVPLEELRLLTLDHWGYDGLEHTGELVVHQDHADAMVRVFGSLWDARFPIERMQVVDAYGGDDAESTRDNNTAAFNCRDVVGRPGAWSEHAFGRAIDVNPLVNPYALDPNVGDPALAQYLDRSLTTPGMIRAGDATVQAFAAEGWAWGGAWSAPDYQHFSATGR